MPRQDPRGVGHRPTQRGSAPKSRCAGSCSACTQEPLDTSTPGESSVCSRGSDAYVRPFPRWCEKRYAKRSGSLRIVSDTRCELGTRAASAQAAASPHPLGHHRRRPDREHDTCSLVTDSHVRRCDGQAGPARAVTLGLALGQSADGWLVEHASVWRSFLAATVAGLILAVLVWFRRATVCPQREERNTGLVSATIESGVVAVATGRRTSARTQRE